MPFAGPLSRYRLTGALLAVALGLSAAAPALAASHTTNRSFRHHHASIPQHNGGDRDRDNNGGPSDGDGNA